MATIPENMSEKDVCELAEKIASSYMQGKDFSPAQFIETFLAIRKLAIEMIKKMIAEEIASYHDNMNNLSLDDISGDLPKSVLR